MMVLVSGSEATIFGCSRFLTNVDDYDLVLAGRGESRFAGIVPVQLVVIADDQKLRLGGGGNSANEGNSCGLRGEPCIALHN